MSYLVGTDEKSKRSSRVVRTLFFLMGFTIIFMLMGATATQIGIFLSGYRGWLLRISGIIMIFFGLHTLRILRLPIRPMKSEMLQKITPNTSVFAFVFGIAYAFMWTPCLTTFLGSALLKAANSDTLFMGLFLLLCFSLGMGIPYLLVAFFYEKATHVFSFLNKNAKPINWVAGGFLILVGLLMLTDYYLLYMSLFD